MVDYYTINCSYGQAKSQLCPINIKKYEDDEYVDDDAYHNGVCDGHGYYHDYDHGHNADDDEDDEDDCDHDHDHDHDHNHDHDHGHDHDGDDHKDEI